MTREVINMRKRTSVGVSRAMGTVLVGLAAAVAVTVVAGCASEPEKGPVDPAESAAYVAEAKRITQDAETGLVYSASNSFAPAGDLKLMDSWLGPTSTPPLPSGKSISFVSCGAPVCNETAQAGARIAQSAGFEATVVNINGSADIQNINQAMSTAISQKPNAVVGVCITGTQVSDKLEQARENGIVTVSTCDPTDTGGPGQFDASADFANGLSAELLGWSIVADSEGTANVVAIKDESFPAVVRKVGNLTEVLDGCGTCVSKTVTWQIADAGNSAKAANILTGIINANPDMDTLVLPYSVGMPSAVQAVASSGREIKIYADDLDAVNQQTLKGGALTRVSSVDPELAMYQAIDQVIRGLNDAPYTAPADLPFVAHLYTEDTVPETGVGAFSALFNYADVYAKLWGR